jgi:hypothetical protein
VKPDYDAIQTALANPTLVEGFGCIKDAKMQFRVVLSRALLLEEVAEAALDFPFLEPPPRPSMAMLEVRPVMDQKWEARLRKALADLEKEKP